MTVFEQFESSEYAFELRVGDCRPTPQTALEFDIQIDRTHSHQLHVIFEFSMGVDPDIVKMVFNMRYD